MYHAYIEMRDMTGEEVAVSANIPRYLKDEFEKSGFKTSEAIRKGLTKGLKEPRVKELEEQIRRGNARK